jgi:hypothetical protein
VKRQGAAGRSDRFVASGIRASSIIEQRHEAEVHVQLLVAMEERHSRIVGDEIKLDFLVCC